MVGFSKAFEELDRVIQEVRLATELVGITNDALAHADEVFCFDRYRPEITQLVQDLLSKRKSNPETLYRGVFIQLGSAFELFVRQCIEGAVERHSKNTQIFDELPKKIADSNFFYTGLALSKINEGVSGRKIDFFEIAKRVGTCYPGNKDFRLNTYAFTLFVGNCTSSNIDHLFDRVGITNIWDKIAKDLELRRHFKSKGTRETAKLTRDKLNEYIRVRNGLVHRGEYFKTITQNEVREYTDFFLVFPKALSIELESL